MAAFPSTGYRLGVEKVEDEPHGIYISPSLTTYFKQSPKIYYQTLLPINLLIYSLFFPVNSHKFLRSNVTRQMWFHCAYFRQREGIKARSMALFVCVLVSATIKYLEQWNRCQKFVCVYCRSQLMIQKTRKKKLIWINNILWKEVYAQNAAKNCINSLN